MPTVKVTCIKKINPMYNLRNGNILGFNFEMVMIRNKIIGIEIKREFLFGIFKNSQKFSVIPRASKNSSFIIPPGNYMVKRAGSNDILTRFSRHFLILTNLCHFGKTDFGPLLTLASYSSRFGDCPRNNNKFAFDFCASWRILNLFNNFFDCSAINCFKFFS